MLTPGFKEDLCPRLGIVIQVFGEFLLLFFFLFQGTFWTSVLFFLWGFCLCFQLPYFLVVSQGMSCLSNVLNVYVFDSLQMGYAAAYYLFNVSIWRTR